MDSYFVIGADLVPTESNFDSFSKDRIDEIVDDSIRDFLSKADFRIFNLETPLADMKNPIDKCGPNLIAPTCTINGYKALGVDLVTIGNNHILDQGEQGFSSTISCLETENIEFVGGGVNLEEASKPYYFNFCGKKIGVYACAEHEFSIAGEKKCGANPYDPLESFDHVVSIARKADYVIVLYHGGKEHYRYPSPGLQKTCRKFIEKGANLVLCQHSHCIGCEEQYQKGKIVYGQGNFLFDHSNNELWKTGLLVCIDQKMQISYYPIVKNGKGIKTANNAEKEGIFAGFNKRSLNILEKGFIEEEYRKFALEMIPMYCMYFGAHTNIFYRVLNRITKGRMNKILYNTRYKNKDLRLTMYDFVACDAHAELLRNGLLQ